jgi:succinate dehydrogenase / fumarate reductase flavoprotein subunit
MSAQWRQVNLVCSLNADGDIDVVEQKMAPMRPDLLGLFTKDELKKYYTDEELVDVPDDASAPASAREEVTA